MRRPFFVRYLVGELIAKVRRSSASETVIFYRMVFGVKW
jgi:DNA-directed RNA polymerase subunit H (RpoH/RPB5)